jgi:hypothetical protein
MLRGGIRLKYLYDIYCCVNSKVKVVDEKLFFTSRFAAAKGCFASDKDYVARIIEREFSNCTIADMVKAVIPDSYIPSDAWYTKTVEQGDFQALLEHENGLGGDLYNVLQVQSKLFKDYIRDLVGDCNEVVLIDTGWTGNTQSMLMRSFSDLEWLGLYFGKWDYNRVHPVHFPNVIGIVVEGTVYNPYSPETAIFSYHHFIEGILEPPIDSTSCYLHDSASEKVRPDNYFDASVDTRIEPQPYEHKFKGIVDYMLDTPRGLCGSEIAIRARLAYRKLARLILFPRRSELESMLVDDRSADFGKNTYVPILIDDKPRSEIASVVERARRSLWTQGQLARDCGVLAPVAQSGMYLLTMSRFLYGKLPVLLRSV